MRSQNVARIRFSLPGEFRNELCQRLSLLPRRKPCTPGLICSMSSVVGEGSVTHERMSGPHDRSARAHFPIAQRAPATLGSMIATAVKSASVPSGWRGRRGRRSGDRGQRCRIGARGGRIAGGMIVQIALEYAYRVGASFQLTIGRFDARKKSGGLSEVIARRPAAIGRVRGHCSPAGTTPTACFAHLRRGKH